MSDVDDIREELLRVLRAAGRPLTLRELAAGSELFDGPASISRVLAAMTVTDEVVRGERAADGRLIYSLPRTAPEAAPCARGGEEREGREERKNTHAAAILEALRQRGPLPRPLLAAAAGCTAKRASDVLTKLARNGQVARLSGGHWALAKPLTGPAEPDQNRANQAEPDQNRANQAEPDQAKAKPDHDKPPAAACPAPLVALRSDGVMEIRRPEDALIVEVYPEELAELLRFANELRGARGRPAPGALPLCQPDLEIA